MFLLGNILKYIVNICVPCQFSLLNLLSWSFMYEYKYVFLCVGMSMPAKSLYVFKFAEYFSFPGHCWRNYSMLMKIIQILFYWMQEKLNRSLMVCQDKYETAKQQNKPGALNDLESCVDQSTQDGIKMLPHLCERLKAAFSLSN